MVIPSVQAIKAETDRALRRANDPRKVILAYTGITVLLSALLTLANALLSDRIAGTGGLGNMGIRSIFSTVQTLLPMVNPKNPIVRFFSFLGRHSLWIYLIHQPLISGICMLFI